MIPTCTIVMTPDLPTFTFHQPRALIDLEKELVKHVRNQGLAAGTYFNVHFVNHDKNVLLARGLFVVQSTAEKLVTNEDNPAQPITRSVTTRRCELIGEWSTWPETPDALEAVFKGNAHKWWVVNGKGEAVAKGLSEDEAEAMAAGKVPVPQAA